MTRHTDFEQRIAVYRSLNAHERTAVDRHVSSCASCAAVYARYTEMDDRLVALPRLPVPASLRVYTGTALQGAARSGRNEAASGGWWQAASASFAPATMVGLVLVGLWLVVSLMTGPHRIGILPPTRTPTATLAVTRTMATGAALATTVSWMPGQVAGLAYDSTGAEHTGQMPHAEPLPTPGAH
jgi:hypothetical protein